MPDVENLIADGMEIGAEGLLSQVSVEIVVSVGKVQSPLKDLFDLQPNAVLPLDRKIEDLVDIYVGGHLVARGELEEIEGAQGSQLGVRVTEITGANGRIR